MTIHTCPTCGGDAVEGTRFRCVNGHTWTTAQWLAEHSMTPDRRPTSREPARIRRCRNCGGLMGGELGTICGRCVLDLKTHARDAVAKEA